MKIKGVEFSEATIVGWAEQAGISFEPKPYLFQAGDVADNNGNKRVIVHYNGVLLAFDVRGNYTTSNSQRYFENNHYRKIGVISDFIK